MNITPVMYGTIQEPNIGCIFETNLTKQLLDCNLAVEWYNWITPALASLLFLRFSFPVNDGHRNRDCPLICF